MLWLRYYYPLSASGTIFFVIASYLLGYSYSYANLYALMATLAIFLTLIVLWLIGITHRARYFPIADSRLFMLSASENYCIAKQAHRMHASLTPMKLPPLFRLHVLARCNLSLDRSLQMCFKNEFIATHGQQLELTLYFPTSGVVNATFSSFFTDIFGLMRLPLYTIRREWLVVPQIQFQKAPNDLRFVQRTVQEKRRMETSSPEKYYVREYIPGDRSKDIHWKASQRLEVLTTKISVQSEQRTREINVLFDHVFPFRKSTQKKTDLRSLLHLEALKSTLLSYVQQSLTHRQDLRIFFCDQRSLQIKNAEDQMKLGQLLAKIQYVSQINNPELLAMSDKVFLIQQRYHVLKKEIQNIVTNTKDRVMERDIFVTYEKRPTSNDAVERWALIDYDAQIFWPGWWLFRNRISDWMELLGVNEALAFLYKQSQPNKTLFVKNNVYPIFLAPRLIL